MHLPQNDIEKERPNKEDDMAVEMVDRENYIYIGNASSNHQLYFSTPPNNMFHQTSLTLAGLIKTFLTLTNSVILLLSGVALVVFLYGGVRFMIGTVNGESHGADKKVLTWGILALFVLFSLGGILRFVEIAFLANAVN